MPMEKVQKVEEFELRDLLMARMHFFVPLDKVIRCYRKKTIYPIEQSEDFTHLKATCRYVALSDFNRPFSFEYIHNGQKFTRTVQMEVFLLEFVPIYYGVNKKQYYLVVGTQVDKVFGDSESETFDEGNLCTAQDLVEMKKAFYGEFFYNDGSQRVRLYEWLDDKLKKITGQNYEGHYGRHYVVDVLATRGVVDSDSRAALTALFSEAYYRRNPDAIQHTFPHIDQLAYGLLFGNNNYDKVPSLQLNRVLGDGFSNNHTEITYAGNSTIVFIKSHTPYGWCPEHQDKQKTLDCDFKSVQNIYEICFVLDAKRRLGAIEKSMRVNNASRIKQALSDMTGFLSKNPLRMGEMDWKMRYLYDHLAITDKFKTLSKMGELSSDAINIRESSKLNHLIVMLTVLTVVFSFIQILLTLFDVKWTVDCRCAVWALLLLVLVVLLVWCCCGRKICRKFREWCRC